MGAGEARQHRLLIRGLYDLADMAASKHDRATEKWAGGLGGQLRGALRRARGGTRRRASTPTRSTTGQRADPAAALDRRHADGGRADHRRRPVPGLAPCEHGTAALAARENDCFSGDAPFNRGLFHTGCGGGPEGKGERSSSRSTRRSRRSARATTAGSARAAAALHDATADVREPATVAARRAAGRAAGDPAVADQRREHRPLLDLPLDVHAGLGPLRHRLAGDPPAARRAARRWGRAARGRAAACPTGQPRVAGDDIRLGDGARRRAAPSARRDAHDAVTVSAPACARCASARRCPRGQGRRRRLDGQRVRKPTVRVTNRGVEVTVERAAAGRHIVTVSAA